MMKTLNFMPNFQILLIVILLIVNLFKLLFAKK